MQSRFGSLLEATLNIGSGFILAMMTWAWIITPLWGFKSSLSDNLKITAIFTVVSIIRSYTWRRIFNKWHIERSRR